MKLTQLFQRFSLLAGLLTIASRVDLHAQATVSDYAVGLKVPIGLESDNQGRLWVAEQGTGNNDSRISVVTTDGMVHPFLTGLPSAIVEGNPAGAQHLYLDANDNLLILQGEGADFLSESVLTISTAGFTPGDTSRKVDDLKAIHKIGRFSLSRGARSTNPYALAIGPENNLFIVDAGFNGIVKLERCTGNLDVFARFAPIRNPTPVGPPVIDAVPTGIVFRNNKFYVGGFVGFPFLADSSRIYEVDLSGNVSVLKTGLTAVVDLALDPRDGNLVFLQFGRFAFAPPPPGFRPNTGGVFKLRAGGRIDTLAVGLNFPSGMRFAANGELFVSSLADGKILKITFPATAVETRSTGTLPRELHLEQNHPNPFNPETRINYALSKAGKVVLRIFNLQGQEVRTLVNEFKPAGAFEVLWDGKDNAGRPMSSGTYLYQIEAQGLAQTRKMLLLQ
jgi:hypothetical protein